MHFLKSNLKRIVVLVLIAALCLGSVSEVSTEAAGTKSSNITSTKVDSNFFKTVKSNGSTWYVASNNPSLTYVARNYVHITGSGKSVGIYSYTAGEYDYTYERLAVMNFNTGKTTMIDEDFGKVSEFCDEYDIFIANAFRDQGYLPDGVKNSALNTYAYFTYDGKRLTNIDYLYASRFYNGYALVKYYKNYEPYYEIIDTKGKSVAALNISKLYNNVVYSYIRAYDSNDKLCYVDVANGGVILYEDEPGALALLVNVAYEYHDKDAVNTFLKQQASKWKKYEYLGKDLFFVTDGSDKTSIINSKGKVILNSDSEGKVLSPETSYADSVMYIDGEIYLTKGKGDYLDYILSVYDSTGKEIISSGKKYQRIMPADGGFLCGYDCNSKNIFLGQSVVDTKGKVIADLPWKNGTLYTFYQGEYINLEHEYYDTRSLPAGETFVISDRYKAVTNTIKSTLLDKKVGNDAYKLSTKDWGDGDINGMDPCWNAVAKTYYTFLKKTGVPAFHAWNLYLTMSASTTAQHPKAGAGVINVNKKGKKIDYLTPLLKNTLSFTSATSTTGNVVDLEWNAVEGAAKYIIEYQEWKYSSYKDSESVYVTVKKATKASVETTGTGLHRFKITAYDSAGHVIAPVPNWTEVKVAKPQVVKVLEDPMKYFTSIDTSVAGEVTLKWAPVDGAYTYRIAVKRATTSGDGVIKNVENATTYTTTLKYAGEDYVFRILAWDKKGAVVIPWTDWTPLIHTTAKTENAGGKTEDSTDKDSSSSKRVAFSSIKSTKSKKATLSWKPVEGATKYYIASKRSTTSGNGSSTTTADTTITLTLKYSDVNYVFRIKAVDDSGNVISDWSEWSEPVYIMK